jgi:hypothetical protein
LDFGQFVTATQGRTRTYHPRNSEEETREAEQPVFSIPVTGDGLVANYIHDAIHLRWEEFLEL